MNALFSLTRREDCELECSDKKIHGWRTNNLWCVVFSFSGRQLKFGSSGDRRGISHAWLFFTPLFMKRSPHAKHTTTIHDRGIGAIVEYVLYVYV